ncbi:precorrin-6y C5,15-methyltransferase (decarboxylating) subunit CbiE [Desulfallas sp. Bu1-1]|uniref:precorrin-6y C5,15-methyltransferase (decarboxylating) subunit CbiE n=1 Tax=Desulfallas sp. Bu1-1 TaxID=2787620 RepID=UPI00189DB684|nr:precorrin-6y C5,15-methyltransferase (decarboxylating) subunit CbiE [Desulfallas sp. Bu1-1]MBF7083289.1 precorrin-6y C5,15-methyltransferase (decarboxylating) subunit CbiE [Desulfallas sp. Bu1-1]
MATITVVGLGPGSKDYLTRAAEEAITQADVLIGGRRQLEMFQATPAEKYTITSDMESVFNIIKSKAAGGSKIVVLASGDPGFYGILSSLKRGLPDLDIRVIPGISSIQLACASLGITWDDAFLTSCHGRDCAALASEVKNHKKVIILTDPKRNPGKLARILLEQGAGDRPVFVACNLSYPNEVIIKTTLGQLAAVDQWQAGNCVMVICDE